MNTIETDIIIKTCIKCNMKKPIGEFVTNRNSCKECKNKMQRDYYYKNKEKVLEVQKIYYQNNIDKIKEYQLQYKESNKEYLAEQQKQYRKDNSDRIKKIKAEYFQKNKKVLIKKANIRDKKRRNSDPVYKLRKSISWFIRFGISSNGAKKHNESFKKYLSYDIEDLKKHLESQFEPWMNWDNWGVYDPKIWNDNDSSTWTWQIDHIIPHSTFKYASMDCQEFRDCWALSNLRPLSSKLNQLEGVLRTRHKTRGVS